VDKPERNLIARGSKVGIQEKGRGHAIANRKVQEKRIGTGEGAKTKKRFRSRMAF
jgi:hypothetical protein